MNRIANGVRNYVRAAAPSNGGNVNPFAQVKNILAKYGTDAHVYLPGIGVINGLTAGNYLNSAGTTAATVDNPVGLVLDAGGSVGSELVDTMNTVTPWTVFGTNTIAQDTNGVSVTYVDNGAGAFTQLNASKGLTTNLTVGSTYVVNCECKVNTGSVNIAVTATGAPSVTITSTSYVPVTIYFLSNSATTNYIGFGAMSAGEIVSIRNISVKEVTGIHATQATTADKMILRNTAGRYWWDAVDGTDLLTTTYPAGYESVITIDAPSTGQVTLTAQNIVGTYNITTDTYGRFVFKTLTAGELAIMQRFANSLAGV